MLELRGATDGELLDEPWRVVARGAGGGPLTWRARIRDDDGRVWRAEATSPQGLAGAWAPAKRPAPGPVAALRSLRPVAIDLRAETADGHGTGGCSLSFHTEHCFVGLDFGQTHDPAVRDESMLDVTCGDQQIFHTLDSPAVSGATHGSTVSLTFDVARAPGTLPAALADDLASGNTLPSSWVNTSLHQGVANGNSNVLTNYVGYGDSVTTGEVG